MPEKKSCSTDGEKSATKANYTKSYLWTKNNPQGNTLKHKPGKARHKCLPFILELMAGTIHIININTDDCSNKPNYYSLTRDNQQTDIHRTLSEGEISIQCGAELQSMMKM